MSNDSSKSKEQTYSWNSSGGLLAFKILLTDDPNQTTRQLVNLHSELLNFCNTIRLQPKYGPVVLAASSLRADLEQLLHLWHQNALEIYPRTIKPLPPSGVCRCTYFLKSEDSGDPHDPERIPGVLQLLATDIDALAQILQADFSLGQCPPIHAAIQATATSSLAYSQDLKYWASCLSDYKGQRTIRVLMYHSLTFHHRSIPISRRKEACEQLGKRDGCSSERHRRRAQALDARRARDGITSNSSGLASYGCAGFNGFLPVPGC